MKLRTVAITVIAAATAVSIGACSSSSSSDASSPSPELNTMTANGVTYKFPKDWQTQKDLSTEAEQGNRAWQQAVGPDTVNLSILSQYNLSVDVTPENIAQIQGEVEQTLEKLAGQAGGKTTGPVTVEATAGYPGFKQTLTVKNPAGKEVDSTVWLFFNGKTQYFLNCQYVTAQQAQLLAGCNTIRSTFSLAS